MPSPAPRTSDNISYPISIQQHDTEAIHVRSDVHTGISTEPLRRNVPSGFPLSPWRDLVAPEKLGDAKVCDPRDAAAVEKDVVRLDVAVDDWRVAPVMEI